MSPLASWVLVSIGAFGVIVLVQTINWFARMRALEKEVAETDELARALQARVDFEIALIRRPTITIDFDTVTPEEIRERIETM